GRQIGRLQAVHQRPAHHRHLIAGLLDERMGLDQSNSHRQRQRDRVARTPLPLDAQVTPRRNRVVCRGTVDGRGRAAGPTGNAESAGLSTPTVSLTRPPHGKSVSCVSLPRPTPGTSVASSLAPYKCTQTALSATP